MIKIRNILNIFSKQEEQILKERIESDRVLPRGGERQFNKKLLLIPVAILLLIVLVTVVLKFVLEPTAEPQNVFISNVSDHQATVSWITDKPVKGAVIASENGSFPIIPILIGDKYTKDDGDPTSSRQGVGTSLGASREKLTHHVTVGNLDPEREYKFRIYEGWKNVYESKFVTGPTLSSLAKPNPVYGRIVDSNNKPIVGALVYLTVSEPAGDKAKKESSILSVLTNSEGRWSIDLGNLRSKNLKLAQSLSKVSVEQLLVDAGMKVRIKAVAKVGMDKPWMDIVIK